MTNANNSRDSGDQPPPTEETTQCSPFYADPARPNSTDHIDGPPMLAIVLVLPAAVANATALVLLRKATEAEGTHPTFSLPMLWVLVRRRPVWGAGIAAMATGAAGRVIAVLATWPDLGADRGRYRRLLPAAERAASRPTGRPTIRHHPGQPGRRLIWEPACSTNTSRPDGGWPAQDSAPAC